MTFTIDIGPHLLAIIYGFLVAWPICTAVTGHGRVRRARIRAGLEDHQLEAVGGP